MTTATTFAAGAYSADPVHSSLQAGVRHMGVGSFRTTFSGVDARLTIDDDGARLTGRVAVESISIRTPAEFRDHVVYGPDFFDAANHPEIALQSSRLALRPDGAVELDGDLVIKGIASAVHATGSWREPVEDPFGGVRAALDLTATIDRRDWDMRWQAALPRGGDALGWDVDVEVHLELVRQAG